MKKSVLAIAIGALSLSLVSCTTKVVEVTPTTEREYTENTNPPMSTDNSAFLFTIYEMYPQLEYQWGDDFLIELGNTICQAIDEGMTFYELALIIVGADADPEQVGYIAGAAIGVYCPWNEWFITTASGF